MLTGSVTSNGIKRIPFRGKAVQRLLVVADDLQPKIIIGRPVLAKPRVTARDLKTLVRSKHINPEHFKPARGTVAIVVAGAECFQREVEQAKALLNMAGLKPLYFLANDQIASFAEQPAVGVTLHPTKLVGWVEARNKRGLPPPLTIWAHRSGAHITHQRRDPHGSVSLLAVYCAMDIGIKKILLCGAPMTKEAGHFIRRRPWNEVTSFRSGWNAQKSDIADYVRSFSGWTKDLLGEPDLTFLDGYERP